VVDAGDYVFLRKNGGSQDVFALYRENFGWSASTGSGSALAAAATNGSAETTNLATAPRTVASATSAQTKESTGDYQGLAAATEMPTLAAATAEQPNNIYFGELRSEPTARAIRSTSTRVGAGQSVVGSDRIDSLLSVVLRSSRDQEDHIWNTTTIEPADDSDTVDAANEALEEAFATLTLL